MSIRAMDINDLLGVNCDTLITHWSDGTIDHTENLTGEPLALQINGWDNKTLADFTIQFLAGNDSVDGFTNVDGEPLTKSDVEFMLMVACVSRKMFPDFDRSKYTKNIGR